MELWNAFQFYSVFKRSVLNEISIQRNQYSTLKTFSEEVTTILQDKRNKPMTSAQKLPKKKQQR